MLVEEAIHVIAVGDEVVSLQLPLPRVTLLAIAGDREGGLFIDQWVCFVGLRCILLSAQASQNLVLVEAVGKSPRLELSVGRVGDCHL